MKSNITVLVPLKKYKKKISKLLSDKLSMFYVDVNELLEFDLINIDKVAKIVGKGHIEKLERKAIKRVSSYNNSLITVDFAALNKDDNLKILRETSLIVYLKFLEKDYIKLLKREEDLSATQIELESKLFNERNMLMQKVSDIIVECFNTNKKDVIKQTLIEINNYYN